MLYFESDFSEICSQSFNNQEASVDSDNGVALNRQSIIWTNDVILYGRI